MKWLISIKKQIVVAAFSTVGTGRSRQGKSDIIHLCPGSLKIRSECWKETKSQNIKFSARIDSRQPLIGSESVDRGGMIRQLKI